MINVAYTSTRDLYEPLAVAIKMLLVHNDDIINKIYIFIQDDEFPYLKDEKRIHIFNTNTLRVIDKDNPNGWNRYTNVPLHICAFHRLIEDDSVLYLDDDAHIIGSIAELDNYDFKDNLIAGAIEPKKSNERPYINFGVTLMNLKGLRESGIGDKALELVNTVYFPYITQDIFNEVCKDRIGEISPRFNSTVFTSQPEDAVVIHGCWNEKWWLETSPRHQEWLKYKELL